jgi:hypothetical protein
MRNIIKVTVLSTALFLGACAHTTDPTTGTTTTTIDPDLGKLVSPFVTPEQIQKASDIAVQTCGYLPAVDTVTGLLATFVPGSAVLTNIASQVGHLICKTITSKGARRGAVAGHVPVVRGVAIRGHFVSR